MKQRLKKKLHKKYLADLILDVSLSSFWRKRLFEAAYGEKFFISSVTVEGISLEFQKIVHRYRLSYKVFALKDEAEDGYVIFKFEATKFPKINGWSTNNITVI